MYVVCTKCGFAGDAEPPLYSHRCGSGRDKMCDYCAAPAREVTDEQRAELIKTFPHLREYIEKKEGSGDNRRGD